MPRVRKTVRVHEKTVQMAAKGIKMKTHTRKTPKKSRNSKVVIVDKLITDFLKEKKVPASRIVVISATEVIIKNND